MIIWNISISKIIIGCLFFSFFGLLIDRWEANAGTEYIVNRYENKKFRKAKHTNQVYLNGILANIQDADKIKLLDTEKQNIINDLKNDLDKKLLSKNLNQSTSEWKDILFLDTLNKLQNSAALEGSSDERKDLAAILAKNPKLSDNKSSLLNVFKKIKQDDVYDIEDLNEKKAIKAYFKTLFSKDLIEENGKIKLCKKDFYNEFIQKNMKEMANKFNDFDITKDTTSKEGKNYLALKESIGILNNLLKKNLPKDTKVVDPVKFSEELKDTIKSSKCPEADKSNYENKSYQELCTIVTNEYIKIIDSLKQKRDSTDKKIKIDGILDMLTEKPNCNIQPTHNLTQAKILSKLTARLSQLLINTSKWLNGEKMRPQNIFNVFHCVRYASIKNFNNSTSDKPLAEGEPENIKEIASAYQKVFGGYNEIGDLDNGSKGTYNKEFADLSKRRPSDNPMTIKLSDDLLRSLEVIAVNRDKIQNLKTKDGTQVEGQKYNKLVTMIQENDKKYVTEKSTIEFLKGYSSFIQEYNKYKDHIGETELNTKKMQKEYKEHLSKNDIGVQDKFQKMNTFLNNYNNHIDFANNCTNKLQSMLANGSAESTQKVKFYDGNEKEISLITNDLKKGCESINKNIMAETEEIKKMIAEDKKAFESGIANERVVDNINNKKYFIDMMIQKVKTTDIGGDKADKASALIKQGFEQAKLEDCTVWDTAEIARIKRFQTVISSIVSTMDKEDSDNGIKNLAKGKIATPDCTMQTTGSLPTVKSCENILLTTGTVIGRSGGGKFEKCIGDLYEKWAFSDDEKAESAANKLLYLSRKHCVTKTDKSGNFILEDVSTNNNMLTIAGVKNGSQGKKLVNDVVKTDNYSTYTIENTSIDGNDSSFDMELIPNILKFNCSIKKVE
ncbi:MAG: hypothetical protein HQK49_00035 [Oligoflexia bacterium]|nr:hypothetical protein [Oligoflexia bacterium]